VAERENGGGGRALGFRLGAAQMLSARVWGKPHGWRWRRLIKAEGSRIGVRAQGKARARGCGALQPDSSPMRLRCGATVGMTGGARLSVAACGGGGGGLNWADMASWAAGGADTGPLLGRKRQGARELRGGDRGAERTFGSWAATTKQQGIGFCFFKKDSNN
jgi:hypothetical protein